MISKGMLGEAQRAARRAVQAMRPLLDRGLPIVGCEPSCLLTFRDEVPDLVPGDAAQGLARHAVLIDEFLAREHRRDPLPLAGGQARTVLVHGHCHQKALAGTSSLQQVLEAAGFRAQMVDAGCCGMAGSFGFEKEHYDLSMAIGERRLLPAVRAMPADAPVVAMGVSCRQRILTERAGEPSTSWSCWLKRSRTGTRQRGIAATRTDVLAFQACVCCSFFGACADESSRSRFGSLRRSGDASARSRVPPFPRFRD